MLRLDPAIQFPPNEEGKELPPELNQNYGLIGESGAKKNKLL